MFLQNTERDDNAGEVVGFFVLHVFSTAAWKLLIPRHRIEIEVSFVVASGEVIVVE